MENKTLGEQCYEVYGKFVENKNWQGLPMPIWKELPEKIQGAWEAAGRFAYKEGLDRGLKED